MQLSFGASSSRSPDAPSYYYKHFAGYSANGIERRDPTLIADELREACRPIYNMWVGLERAFLSGHLLSRCYANVMPPGVGGGIHRDSQDPTHMTLIYYPNLRWAPGDGGETLFYNEAETTVVRTVEPVPNRLVVFSGSIPHMARALSAAALTDRITLMFKTFGPLVH
jgi:SM-20-related protein